MKKTNKKVPDRASYRTLYLRAVNIQKAEVKPKPTVNCKNAHCQHIIVHNCTAQYSREQLW